MVLKKGVYYSHHFGFWKCGISLDLNSSFLLNPMWPSSQTSFHKLQYRKGRPSHLWKTMSIHTVLSHPELSLNQEALGFSCLCQCYLFYTNIPSRKNTFSHSFSICPSCLNLALLLPKTLQVSSLEYL
jgi:hypothetical protein